MPEKLEERVALLEAEVARLKDKVESDIKSGSIGIIHLCILSLCVLCALCG